MRTLEDIQRDYAQRCTALGELRWRLHIVEHQISEEIRKIEALDLEAFRVKNQSAESDSVQPQGTEPQNVQE